MPDPLVLDAISKSFGGVRAVDGVSLRVGQGQIMGFLGPNGAGKTTTIRMALGLIAPDEGSALLFGQSPGPASFGRIGFLPEERGLYRKSTARGAIAHIAQLNGLSRRQAYARADSLLEAQGLGEAGRLKVKALSKGMAQKVQLLAAIAHNPEFLILDEPFSGLDPVNQGALEEMIRKIAASGATIIFSTHVMEHAERLCDRIVLMSRGRKVFDGSVDGALANVARSLTLAFSASDMTQAAAKDWLAAFASQVTHVTQSAHVSPAAPNAPQHVYRLSLKGDHDSQAVLQACVEKGLRVTQFEPSRPTLHDAFVQLVGEPASIDEPRPQTDQLGAL